jgi:hypothetical protein
MGTLPKLSAVGVTRSCGPTPVPAKSYEYGTPFTDNVAVWAAGPVVVGLNA